MVRLQRKVKIQNTIKVNVQVILLFIFTIFFYLQNMTMLSTTLCNLMMVAAQGGRLSRSKDDYADGGSV